MINVNLTFIKDESLANSLNMKSQLGFVLLVIDETGRENVIHYGSNRCKRVTRSFMASDLHALVLGYDSSYTIQHLVEEIRGRSCNFTPIQIVVQSSILSQETVAQRKEDFTLMLVTCKNHILMANLQSLDGF